MISFELTEEQEEFERTLRRFLEARAPVAVTRRFMDGDISHDADVWREMAERVGVQGLHVPERHGGAGAGFVEVASAAESIGRVLYPGPFLASSVLATEVLLESGDEGAMSDYLPGLSSGECSAALAIGGCPGIAAPKDVVLRTRRGDGRLLLDGDVPVVMHGREATLLLAPAQSAGGISLVAVEAGAPGVSRVELAALDGTRRLARVSFSATPCRLVGEEGGAWPAVEAALDRGTVALAADALGVAERSLEMSVEHAKARFQFGRPIGSFQVIKHRCADMLMSVELARSAVCYASRAIDARANDLRAAASIALATSAEAAFLASSESIQIHGGIGFTWEHDAHLFFKRARADAAYLGTPAEHRERLLVAIGVD